MFEGLFQPMHLIVIFWDCAADFRAEKAASARQRNRRRYSRIQARDGE